MLGNAFKYLAKARALFTETTLINGVVSARGKMCVDSVCGAYCGTFGRDEHTKLHHSLSKAQSACYYRFSAAVRSCEDVYKRIVLVEACIVCDDLRVIRELERDGGIVKLHCVEYGRGHIRYLGGAEGTVLCHKAIEHIGTLDDKFDLGHKREKEIGIFKHVGVYDLFPGFKRGAIDLVYRGIECGRERGLLVIRLALAEGNKICNAGILVVLEAESQNLVNSISRLEWLGVYRENARVRGAELSIEVDTYRDALYLADALCQLVKLLIELGVILRLCKLRDLFGKHGKRAAVKLVANILEPIV